MTNGKLDVLVIFEESQEVCKAFRRLGHNAYSCDIKPCSGRFPEWHFQSDIYQVLFRKKWDIIIGHPPCTALCVSGNSTYAKGKPKHSERIKAAIFTEGVWKDCLKITDKVCFENPVGVLTTLTQLPKPQYIQPFEFGHPEPKKTALFLNKLPKLKPTKIVEPEYIVSGGKKYSRTHYLTDYLAKKFYGQDRATVRSKTYPGIATAMAEQWSKYALEQTNRTI